MFRPKTVSVLGFILILFFFSSTTITYASEVYSNWLSQTSLPYNLASNQAIETNNKIYVIGGGDTNLYRTDIYSADINNDFSINIWQKRGDLPQALIWHSVSKYLDNLYVIGGAKQDPDINHVSTVNTVYKAKIDLNGNIINWQQENVLPLHLGRGGTFIYANRIYYLGGLLRSANSSIETVSSSVYFSNIDQTGDINNWTQTTSLPAPISEFATYLFDNKIYVVGGMNSNSTPSNKVYIGTINEITGEITWTNGQNLPTGLRRPAFTQIQKKLFLIAGFDGTTFIQNTYTSEIKTDGSLGNWVLIPSLLSHGDCCNSAVSTNRSIYLIGGHDGSYYSDVFRLDYSNVMSVPDLKQYSSPWANLEYDNAHIWSPIKNNIARFGCAITAISMVLQYYGYNINPESLNSWLNLNNGYISDGLVDWSAVTRWVRLEHQINPLLPKLEYNRVIPFDTAKLNTELDQDRPVIAKIANADGSTHFVVVTGKSGNTYLINDPANLQSLLSYYPTSSYNRIDTLTPSNTDLSYLYFYSSPNTSFEFIDTNGNITNSGFTIEGPYLDQVEHSISNMKSWQSLALPKPKKGVYTVRLQGSGSFNSIARLYDVNANMIQSVDSGIIKNKQIKTYLITIENNQKTEVIDFKYIRQDIKNAYMSKKIKNEALYYSLILQINNAESAYQKGVIKTSKTILNTVKFTINATSKLIDANYRVRFTTLLGYLEESL